MINSCSHLHLRAVGLGLFHLLGNLSLIGSPLQVVPWTDTIKPFSAVCWLYAKYIYQKRGVPMGLVETAWGGTNIEAWSSPDSIHACKLQSDGGHKYELWLIVFVKQLLLTHGAI